MLPRLIFGHVMTSMWLHSIYFTSRQGILLFMSNEVFVPTEKQMTNLRKAEEKGGKGDRRENMLLM
jgi:hypothetical protein